MEKKLKICCATGHRSLPAEKVQYVKQKLYEEILNAIGDGYNYFNSGFADGVDLIFAETVACMKQERTGIYLEAAIPYPNRLKSKNSMFAEVLKQCDVLHTVCDKYTPACFRMRNQYMVEQAERVIAVYDGRQTGGTFTTVVFARSHERDLKTIDI